MQAPTDLAAPEAEAVAAVEPVEAVEAVEAPAAPAGLMTSEKLIKIVKDAEQPLLSFQDEVLITRICADLWPKLAPIQKIFLDESSANATIPADIPGMVELVSELKSEVEHWIPQMPGSRMRAFGVALLQHFFKYIKQEGGNEVTLEVWVEGIMTIYRSNPARFERLGWEL